MNRHKRGAFGGARPKTPGGFPRPGRNSRPATAKRNDNYEHYDDTELLHHLMATKSGFQKRIHQNDPSEANVTSILQSVSRALQSNYAPETRSKLLVALNGSLFLKEVLPSYFSHCFMKKDFLPSIEKTLEQALGVLKKISKHLPTASLTIVTNNLSIMKIIIEKLASSFVDRSLEHLLDQVSFIEKSHSALLEALQKREIKRGKDHAQYERPPDDFREISLFPKPKEILSSTEPFLRRNNVFGAYVSVDDYLDTQFRLLREDCIQPLRHGIRQLKDCIKNGQKPDQRHMDINVYNGVRILYPIGTSKGVAFRVKFDIKHLARIQWDKSKRLLTGALVCLSKDNFSSVLIGVIADHDAKSLAAGVVDLFFEGQYLQTLTINQHDVYQMVESTAYFEAYRYNLQGLQEMENDQLPFSKYLLNQSESPVDPPEYIRGNNISFDFSCLVPSKKNVKILDEKDWPTEEQLQLDSSQCKALRTALTKEFSVIQGPPGTGKTYIGLKIAQLLIANKKVWNTGNRPILVVCYTNHALDQFLEGILKFTSSDHDMIVRMGGREPESEDLKRCLIQNIKKSYRSFDNYAKAEIYGEMDEYKERLQQLSTCILSVSRGIFHENYLLMVMQPHHYNRLMNVAFELNHAAELNAPAKKEEGGILYWTSAIVTWLIDASNGEVQSRTNIPGSSEEMNEADEFDDIEDDMNTERVYNLDVMRDIQHVVTEISKHASKYVEHALTEREIRAIVDGKRTTKDKDGFTGSVAESTRRHFQQILDNLRSTNIMTDDELSKVTDVWALSSTNRWRLYRKWVDMYIMLKLQDIRAHYQPYNDLTKRLQEARTADDFAVLRNATVIGMTTTGAAKNRLLLQRVRPRIVIVEEAAEVLEAHIITSLSPDCQQLILIGDHLQLRPSTTVYQIAQHYNLDISLFERMVKNDMHCDQLSIQHRMRPEIVDLIVPHIYKQLVNHESVLNYENIQGMGSNIYFLHHENLEDRVSDSKSKSNLYEAKMCGALSDYLQKQAYEPSQITILTMYTGQMFLLRQFTNVSIERKSIKLEQEKRREARTEESQMKSWIPRIRVTPVDSYQGEENDIVIPRIRVTPVDSYQGEENDIVILSLVRSNEEGKVGFLKIANRVCVALSRAKKGFYVIGNMKMLKESSSLWESIIKMLEQRKQLVTSFTLHCPNHKETKTEVRQPKDFDRMPDGGCQLKCEARLDCGHACTRYCHGYDRDHKEFVCKKPCQRVLCDMGHRCPKLCYKPCGKCSVMVEKTKSKCGHLQRMPCHVDEKEFECQKPCEKLLKCEHQCTGTCGSSCIENCLVKVVKELRCTHKQKMCCYFDPRQAECKEDCNLSLACGHSCKNRCSKPCTKQCEETVLDREWPCGHKWSTACFHNEHNFPCTYKVDKTPSYCSHTQSAYCYQEPKDLDCKQQCEKFLDCGHRCQEKCKDACTEQCTILVPDRPWPCGHKLTLPCHLNAGNFTCEEMTLKSLPCGHEMKMKCNVGVQDVGCQEKVLKPLPCGHQTTMKCSSSVSGYRCFVPVTKCFPCGHESELKCVDAPTAVCVAVLERELPCGHNAKLKCSDPIEKAVCMADVSITKCEKHTIIVKCNKANAERNEKCEELMSKECSRFHPQRVKCYEIVDDICTSSCGETLPCGHTCTSTCKDCRREGFHSICVGPCCRKLPCGHKCHHICGEPCMPCQESPLKACPHNSVTRKTIISDLTRICGQSMESCTRPCLNECIHKRCTKLCGEECDVEECTEACPESLPCGHPCTGICGLSCPPICRRCNKADFQMLQSVQNFKLTEDSRFLVLFECHHIVETGVLKQQIEQVKQDKKVQYVTCPMCAIPVLHCVFYQKDITKINENVEKAKKIIILQWKSAIETDELIRSLKINVNDMNIVRKLISSGALNVLHLNKIMCEKRNVVSTCEEIDLMKQEMSSLCKNIISKSVCDDFDEYSVCNEDILRAKIIFIKWSIYMIVNTYRGRNLKFVWESDVLKLKPLLPNLTKEYAFLKNIYTEPTGQIDLDKLKDANSTNLPVIVEEIRETFNTWKREGENDHSSRLDSAQFTAKMKYALKMHHSRWLVHGGWKYWAVCSKGHIYMYVEDQNCYRCGDLYEIGDDEDVTNESSLYEQRRPSELDEYAIGKTGRYTRRNYLADRGIHSDEAKVDECKYIFQVSKEDLEEVRLKIQRHNHNTSTHDPPYAGRARGKRPYNANIGSRFVGSDSSFEDCAHRPHGRGARGRQGYRNINVGSQAIRYGAGFARGRPMSNDRSLMNDVYDDVRVRAGSKVTQESNDSSVMDNQLQSEFGNREIGERVRGQRGRGQRGRGQRGRGERGRGQRGRGERGSGQRGRGERGSGERGRAQRGRGERGGRDRGGRGRGAFVRGKPANF